MNLSYYIAKRYAFSKSNHKAINIITRIATVGIVVSAMAMFVVLSIFSGLRLFSLSFVNELDPSLKVESLKGKSFNVTDDQWNALSSSSLFSGVAKVVEDRLVFSYREKQVVATIKGVDDHFDSVSDYTVNVEVGDWLEEGTNQAVIGAGVLRALSMGFFDTEEDFMALAMKPGQGVIHRAEDAFIQKKLYPMGVYMLRNDDFDSRYVFTDINLARSLLNVPTTAVTALELKMFDERKEKEALTFIKNVFPDQEITIKNRMQLNEGLYRMLNTENLVVYLIFILVVIMALFTLVGSLIMIILEKQGNMITLYNFGATVQSIRKVFLLQGVIISVLGAVVGLILGVLVVFLQQRYSFLMINESFAYPVAFTFTNMVLVVTSIIVLGMIAAMLAASRVNKQYIRTVQE